MDSKVDASAVALMTLSIWKISISVLGYHIEDEDFLPCMDKDGIY